MADPFVSDPDFTLHVGDALEVLRQMPAESVHCVVTSPPYWGLRDYGTGTWDGGDADCDHIRIVPQHENSSSSFDAAHKSGQHPFVVFKDVCGKCGARRVDQQLGLEATPDQYVTNMVAVFREVRRVLRADGTLWLNIGDSYAANGNGGGSVFDSGRTDGRKSYDGDKARGRETALARVPVGLKPKDLVGIPWRLAFALQADGWYLRSDIIWAKPNPMPESVTDRPTKAHEYLFLLSKSPRYFYDADAIREDHSPDGRHKTVHDHATPNSHPNYDSVGNGNERWPNGGRNKRSVWEIATEAYPDAHFATFPQALVEPCVKAGTSEHGCCPECGAPWVREVERGEQVAGKVGTTQAERQADRRYMGNNKPGEWQGGQGTFAAFARNTTGWAPSCGHAGLPVPPTVLDPFLGSGTTALVARRLGRRCIGIELNPEYARLAAKRLAQLSLFACAVDESAGLADEATDRG